MHDLLSNVYPVVTSVVHIQPFFDHISAVRKAVSGSYIHVHVERDYFNLIIFTDNQLKFCNTYSYRNISDILYFVLNVFTRLGIKQEETIYFSGLTEKYDDLTSGFSIYVKNIKFSEPKGTFTFSYVFNEIGLHKFLNLFSVFNCG